MPTKDPSVIFNEIQTRKLVEIIVPSDEFEHFNFLACEVRDSIVKISFHLEEYQVAQYKSIDVSNELYKEGAYYVYPPILNVVREQQKHVDMDENHQYHDDPFKILEEFLDEKANKEVYEEALEIGKRILEEVIYD